MHLLLNNVGNGQFERPVVVYIVPQEQLRNVAVPESNLYQFVKRGDLIVPFHATREEWRKEVAQIIQKSKEMTDATENEYSLQATGNPHPSSLSLPSRRSYI